MAHVLSGETFAEAYSRRKERDSKESRNSKARKEDTLPIVSNISDLDSVMQSIIKELEQDSPNGAKYIKTTLREIPSYFTPHVTDWNDSDNLDLMHHFIINNKADLITFIYTETNYFHMGHIPACNPYAHLAALLGNLDCLKAILQYRPSTFFKTEKPSHAIRLPNHVKKKTKLDGNVKPLTKGTEKILDKIKSSTMYEELKMEKVSSSDSKESDITNMLDKDLDIIEKAFSQNEKRLPKHSAHKDKIKQERLKHIPRKSEDDDIQARQRKGPKTMDEDTVIDHFKRHTTRGDKKHIITVFCDAMFDKKAGVVKGAGERVTLKLTPQAAKKKPCTGIESIDRSSFQSRRSSESRRSSDSSSTRTSKPMALKSKPSHQNLKLPNIADKAMEMGVRGKKKYKEFQLKIPKHPPIEKDETEKYMNKTPLTLAAERGNIECALLILQMVVLKRHPTVAPQESLTLATKARSPEAIMLILEKRCSRSDYQNAVMVSIREMYPDCLTALLSNKSKDRSTLFEGTNLYHILYSQNVISNKRYELMPVMTKALVACKEDVNAHAVPRTFPMYTLINCAFNITVGKQIFFFIDCLHILLKCKANPHYNEEKQTTNSGRKDMLSRQAFKSAINCVFESAKNSVNFFESSYWSKLFMKKFITSIEMLDLTSRRVLNNVLFDYMEAVCSLGLDRTIVRCLLRYGGNPDFKRDGKYPVNVYFDELLPYLTRFEIIGTYDRYRQELATLMIICKHMSVDCLSDSLRIFLSEHLLSAPIQALPIAREFVSLLDRLLRTPRPLSELAVRTIWLKCQRNKKKVMELPIPDNFIPLIIP